MFCAFLGSTTVSLVDSVSRGDPKWIFYSSGDYHDLTGRSNKCSVLFWEAPPSYWKILSLSSVADSIFHKKFYVVFLCYQFLLHQSSHVIFWSPVKLRLYNSKRNCKIEDLDRVLFEWTSSKESWRNATLTI